MENKNDTEKIIALFKERQKSLERIEFAEKLKSFMKKEATNKAYFMVLENNIMDKVITDNDLRTLQKEWGNELLEEYRAKEYYEYNKGNVKAIACGTNMTNDEIQSAIRYAYFQYFIETFLTELERIYCLTNNRPFPLPIDYDARAKMQKIIDEKVKKDAEAFFDF